MSNRLARELVLVARELVGAPIQFLRYEASEWGDGAVWFRIGEAVWRYDMVGEDAVTAYKIARYSSGKALAWVKKHKVKETRERAGGVRIGDSSYPRGDDDPVSEITHCQHSGVP